MELQEKSGTTCPPFVLEAKSRLENVELKSSLQFLAAVREISKAFNEKTEIIEQNVEETRNALLLKLNSLKECKKHLLFLKDAIVVLRDEYLSHAHKTIEELQKTFPDILVAFEKISIKQNALRRLELESRGRELLTLLANSVRSRNLDEIKFNLEETGNHEKTCKEVDFEFKLYSTALLESYAESLPDIRSQLYSFLEKKLKFPFEEGNATVVAHEDATVLHKYVDIITYLMKRTHPDDWPTEIAAIFFKPISDRFLYHFYGDRKTNDKYNPRWFLTQLLSWIRVNLLFFEQTMGVAKGITSFNPAAFFHYRISALANDKIASILSMDEAMTDPLLFSKLVDEVVQFEEDRQQLDCFRYGVNSLTMFCSEKIVKHWIQMEHEVSIAYLDDILSDGKRWTGRLGEIDDVDEYNVCQCVDSFVTHVQCVHNRSRLLPDPYVKRLFIDLQLFLFDEFRERLSQIANTADSPWSEPFPQIMNATWFLCDTLKEWSETDILNTRLGEGSTLDSTSRMYKHLWTQMADNAANSVRIQTTEMAQQYQQYKWASVDLIMSPSKEISPPFCPLLLKIRSIFATAGNVLSRVSLNTIFKRFITVVADVLYKEVIRCTAFVEFGASQMLFDIEEGLVPVLNNIFDRNRLSSVQSTNNLQMLKLISALRILSLPWPVATLLREEIVNSTPEQVNEKLLEMKIVGLTGDEAEKLFGQRSDMKSTNIVNIAVK